MRADVLTVGKIQIVLLHYSLWKDVLHQLSTNFSVENTVSIGTVNVDTLMIDEAGSSKVLVST